MQKYRADFSEQMLDGSEAWYAKWLGGSSLAKINNCQIYGHDFRLTVYIMGEPDTYFSQPAATRKRGKYCKGFVTKEEGCFVFHPMDDYKHILED